MVLWPGPVGEAYSLDPFAGFRCHFAAGRKRKGQGNGMEEKEEGKGKKRGRDGRGRQTRKRKGRDTIDHGRSNDFLIYTTNKFRLYFYGENRITSMSLRKIYKFSKIKKTQTAILLCFGCTDTNTAENRQNAQIFHK